MVNNRISPAGLDKQSQDQGTTQIFAKNSPAERDYQYVNIGLAPFDLNDYIGNAAMIKRLYQDVYHYEKLYRDATEQVNGLNTQVIGLNTQVEVLNVKNRTSNQISLIQAILVLIGSTLLAFGVSIVTTAQTSWPGWIMSVGGFIIQFFALGIPLLLRLQER